jgi:hypothetical protein
MTRPRSPHFPRCLGLRERYTASVDNSGPLELIARSLPHLPPESVESMLVTFDTLANLAGEASRPEAVRFLQDAAAQCQDPASKERLLRAADAVAAGEPCALTPEGLTGQQAAAASTITLEEWQARGGDAALLEEELWPPALPHLRVRHFFRGLVVYVARQFSDANGLAMPSGERMCFRKFRRSGKDEYTLSFRERNLRLRVDEPSQQAIFENEGNQWFQPEPSIGCLRELCDLVDERLSEAGLHEPESEFAEPIVADFEECQAWLFEQGERGPAPQCESGVLAAGIFGGDSELAAWIPLLFAGVAAAGSQSPGLQN